MVLAPEPALTGLLHPIGTASLQSSDRDCVGEHPVKHLSVIRHTQLSRATKL